MLRQMRLPFSDSFCLLLVSLSLGSGENIDASSLVVSTAGTSASSSPMAKDGATESDAENKRYFLL